MEIFDGKKIRKEVLFFSSALGADAKMMTDPAKKGIGT